MTKYLKSERDIYNFLWHLQFNPLPHPRKRLRKDYQWLNNQGFILFEDDQIRLTEKGLNHLSEIERLTFLGLIILD